MLSESDKGLRGILVLGRRYRTAPGIEVGWTDIGYPAIHWAGSDPDNELRRRHFSGRQAGRVRPVSGPPVPAEARALGAAMDIRVRLAASREQSE